MKQSTLYGAESVWGEVWEQVDIYIWGPEGQDPMRRVYTWRRSSHADSCGWRINGTELSESLFADVTTPDFSCSTSSKNRTMETRRRSRDYANATFPILSEEREREKNDWITHTKAAHSRPHRALDTGYGTRTRMTKVCASSMEFYWSEKIQVCIGQIKQGIKLCV